MSPKARSLGAPTPKPESPVTAQAWRAAAVVRRPVVAILLALLLVAAIGTADYLTGYEVRLAILYILPVALATWVCGRGWGFLIAVLGPIMWAASFASLHVYSRDLYFYWDCVVMAVTLLLFVELLARLRAALARSDERFMRVLEGLYAAVYVTDDRDRVLFANRQLVRLLGEEAEALTLPNIAARFAAVPAEAPRSDKKATRATFVATEVRDTADGRWYLVHSGTIPWVDRRHVRLSVMTDVTDQKRAEQVQREHQATLHHTAQLVNLAEAGTTLAHELNQPLLAIVGYNAACIRLLESGVRDEDELLVAMQKTRAQAVRAGEIVHRLRELTRRHAPELVACDLNSVIRETLRWAQSDLDRARIAVDLGLTEPLAPVRIDRILIEQVILNLVQNAIDSMCAGDPTERWLRLESARGVDGTVTVTIRDRGPGITDPVARQLYTPFFTTKEQGLGLGLSICRSIVEMHRGRLWHDANPEGGASFHFTLPDAEA